MDLTLYVIIGCLGMFIMAGFLITFVILYQKRLLANKLQMEVEKNRYQQSLYNTQIEIQDMERMRIASNIHDQLGGILNTVDQNVQWIASNEKISSDGSEKINQTIFLIDKSIQDVRDASRDLAPKILQRLGLVSAVKDLARQLVLNRQLEINIFGNDEDVLLNDFVKLHLYRIFQELFFNCIKHALPTKIDFELKLTDRLEILLTHNGTIVSNDELKAFALNSKGLGLKSIFNRIELIKANIDFGGNNNKAIVKICIPTNEK